MNKNSIIIFFQFYSHIFPVPTLSLLSIFFSLSNKNLKVNIEKTPRINLQLFICYLKYFNVFMLFRCRSWQKQLISYLKKFIFSFPIFQLYLNKIIFLNCAFYNDTWQFNIKIGFIWDFSSVHFTQVLLLNVKWKTFCLPKLNNSSTSA